MSAGLTDTGTRQKQALELRLPACKADRRTGSGQVSPGRAAFPNPQPPMPASKISQQPRRRWRSAAVSVLGTIVAFIVHCLCAGSPLWLIATSTQSRCAIRSWAPAPTRGGGQSARRRDHVRRGRRPRFPLLRGAPMPVPGIRSRPTSDRPRLKPRARACGPALTTRTRTTSEFSTTRLSALGVLPSTHLALRVRSRTRRHDLRCRSGSSGGAGLRLVTYLADCSQRKAPVPIVDAAYQIAICTSPTRLSVKQRDRPAR